jgi:hypothetical protein
MLEHAHQRHSSEVDDFVSMFSMLTASLSLEYVDDMKTITNLAASAFVRDQYLALIRTLLQ